MSNTSRRGTDGLNLSRRSFMAAGVAAAAVGFRPHARAQAAPTGAAAGRRPNVLILQSDQHLGSMMGCMGDATTQTPNLDRLAGEGTLFTRSVSNSPVCTPWRASMQTGVYWHRHGAPRNNMCVDLSLKGLAQCFADAGYATGYIGKWHISGEPVEGYGGHVPPAKRLGWQDWLGHEKGHRYTEVTRVTEAGNEVLPQYDWEPDWHTDEAIRFIRRHEAAGTPWVYYISYGPPHSPYQVPQRYLDLYDPDEIPFTPAQLRTATTPEQQSMLREYLHYYRAMTTGMDDALGRLLRELQAMGAADNTLVVYTADHGDFQGSHLSSHVLTSYEGKRRFNMHSFAGKNAPVKPAFHTPLIMRWPGQVQGGERCDALFPSIDLPPTLLTMAGLDVPGQMQGRDMSGWATTGRGPVQEAVYLGTGYGQWRGVYDGRHVYSTSPIQQLGPCLYDHANDPHELENLFGQRASLQRQMHDQMVHLAELTQDPEVDAVKASASA